MLQLIELALALLLVSTTSGYLPPKQAIKIPSVDPAVVNVGGSYANVPEAVNYDLTSVVPAIPAVRYGSINAMEPATDVRRQVIAGGYDRPPAVVVTEAVDSKVVTVVKPQPPPPPPAKTKVTVTTGGGSYDSGVVSTERRKIVEPTGYDGAVKTETTKIKITKTKVVKTAPPPPPPPTQQITSYLTVPEATESKLQYVEPPPPPPSTTTKKAYVYVAPPTTTVAAVRSPPPPPPPPAKKTYGYDNTAVVVDRTVTTDGGYGAPPPSPKSSSVVTAAKTKVTVEGGGYGQPPTVDDAVVSKSETKKVQIVKEERKRPVVPTTYGRQPQVHESKVVRETIKVKIVEQPKPEPVVEVATSYGGYGQPPPPKPVVKVTSKVTSKVTNKVTSKVTPNEPVRQSRVHRTYVPEVPATAKLVVQPPPPPSPSSYAGGYGSLGAWRSVSKDHVTGARTDVVLSGGAETEATDGGADAEPAPPMTTVVEETVVAGGNGNGNGESEIGGGDDENAIAPTAAPAPAPPAANQECTNKSEYCDFWKDSGECEKNPAYMKVNCGASCNSC